MSPLELLLQIQSQDASGLLFVVTDHGRQIRIGIDGGRIVQIGYGPHRGRVALEMASATTAQSATFRSDLATSVDADLPSERAVLGLLSRMLTGVAADPAAGAAGSFVGEDVAPTEPGTNPPPSWSSTTSDDAGGARTTRPRITVEPAEAPRLWSTITPIEVERVKRLLLEFVGPVAEFLVEEQVSAGAPNVQALIEAVAKEIDSPRDARSFLIAAERMGFGPT